MRINRDELEYTNYRDECIQFCIERALKKLKGEKLYLSR